MRVSVWWDFENCQLPAGTPAFRVSQSITAAIRANGIKGPIQITAFGDVMQLSRSNQEVLSSTGINLTHVPHGLFFSPFNYDPVPPPPPFNYDSYLDDGLLLVVYMNNLCEIM